MGKLQLKNAMNFHFCTNFIILGFVSTALYALCFFIMRLSLALSTFEDFTLVSAFNGDFAKMFIMGFRLDMRAICVVFAVFILLGYIAGINKALFKTSSRGGGI